MLHATAVEPTWLPPIGRYVRLHGVDADGACRCSLGTSCGSPGKHPKQRGWKDASLTTAEEARMWLAEGDNLGLATGDGWWVVDIDGDAGEATWKTHVAEHGHPVCVEVRTSRGRHLWFKAGPAVVPKRKLGVGIDIQGHGALIVCPGSTHTSGVTYLATAGVEAEAPPWLLDLVGAARPAEAGAKSKAAQRALDTNLARIRHATPGSRRFTIIAETKWLLRVAFGGALDENLVEREVRSAAAHYAQADGSAQLESAISYARQKAIEEGPYVFTTYRPSPREVIYDWRSVAGEVPWPSRNDHRYFLGLLDAMEARATTRLRLGQIGLSNQYIEATQSTVSRFVRRVASSGLDILKVHQRGKRSDGSRHSDEIELLPNAHRYREHGGVRFASAMEGGLPMLEPDAADTPRLVGHLPANHECFGHGAVRQALLALHRTLVQCGPLPLRAAFEHKLGSKTASAYKNWAASIRGKHRDKSKQELHRMAFRLLIEEMPDGTVAARHVEEDTLDLLASTFGRAGSKERRQATHALKQQAYYGDVVPRQQRRALLDAPQALVFSDAGDPSWLNLATGEVTPAPMPEYARRSLTDEELRDMAEDEQEAADEHDRSEAELAEMWLEIEKMRREDGEWWLLAGVN